jgi:hypothetical protein
MKLWIGNLPSNKNDEDVRAFVQKCTQIEIDAITHFDRDGSRPGVLIEIGGATQLMLLCMQRRLHQTYWDQHELNVRVPSQTKSRCLTKRGFVQSCCEGQLAVLERCELDGVSKGKRRC